MDSYVSAVNSNIEKYLQLMQASNVWPYISLFIILYATHLGPTLPKKWLQFVNNAYFRIVAIALMMWTATSDPALSLVMAVLFVALVNRANNKNILENFTWEGPQTGIYPGCLNMTVNDLLESFGNDEVKLAQAIAMSKIPANIDLSDYYAPIIATYLMYSGFNLKSPCTPPSGDSQQMW